MDDILFVGTKGNEKNDGIVCCHVNNEIYQISKMEDGIFAIMVALVLRRVQ